MSDDSSKKGRVSPGFAHEQPRPHEEEGGEGWLISYADMMTLLVGFFVILLSFSSMDPEKFDAARKSITKEFGGNYQVPYAELAEHIKEVAKKLGVGDQLLIKQTEVGIEISSRGTVFFELGSADLKPEARAILKDFIESTRTELGEFDIAVEGHTDDIPIVSGKIFRTNWELSSLRACRVLDTFVAAGFPVDRLTAAGYGEARPLFPNRDASGQPIVDNQGQNRRVVIKLTEHPKPALVKTEEDPAAPVKPAGEPARSEASGPAETLPSSPAPSAASSSPSDVMTPTTAGSGPAPASVSPTTPSDSPAAPPMAPAVVPPMAPAPPSTAP